MWVVVQVEYLSHIGANGGVEKVYGPFHTELDALRFSNSTRRADTEDKHDTYVMEVQPNGKV